MPIYPYLCSACGHEFDLLQKVSDDPLRQCPECGVESLRRKLTAAAFHLKGTGWYETDFKNKEKKKDKKEEQKEAGKESAKDKAEVKKDDAKAKVGKSDDKAASSSTSQSSKDKVKKADS